MGGLPGLSPALAPGSDGIDATLPGLLPWVRTAYDLGPYLVDDAGLAVYRYPAPINGTLLVPQGDGPFPLILLLHGRHGTCSVAGTGVITVLSPLTCPNAFVVEPIDSYLGYGYLAENLASHGYAVASVNANAINDRDGTGTDSGANARAQLVLRTLDELQAVNATGHGLPDATMQTGGHTDLSAFKGRLDLSRIGLMGHSRGGEGVTRAITMNPGWPTPHNIKAVFALAPTDFKRWTAPGVAFAVLLPYCDGDVSDLQGGKIFDDSRDLPGEPHPRFQVVDMGADHNYYNSVWTSDDWGTRQDAHCDGDAKGRDTPEAQRQHGLDLMGSFFRLFVGGEAQFAPTWFDGEVPAKLCTAAQQPCTDRIRISADPVPADRTLLSRDGGGARSDGNGGNFRCAPPDCPSKPTVGSASQTYLAGDKAGRFEYAELDVPLEGRSWLTFRAGAVVKGHEVRMRVLLTSDEGQTLTNATLRAPPGTAAAKTILDEVRIPLAGLGGHLRSIVLMVPESGRQFQVADVMLQR
ncbi:MAG TPA: hypothetical protein VM286_10620 [Candidatus Thermoplasmatota archaeon]|nr:hypothetical protein [Candidatus Thermoplasmatota archaeon]